MVIVIFFIPFSDLLFCLFFFSDYNVQFLLLLQHLSSLPGDMALNGMFLLQERREWHGHHVRAQFLWRRLFERHLLQLHKLCCWRFDDQVSEQKSCVLMGIGDPPCFIRYCNCPIYARHTCNLVGNWREKKNLSADSWTYRGTGPILGISELVPNSTNLESILPMQFQVSE